MNQITKTAVGTFGCLLVISLVNFGWQAYEKSKEEAELQRYCKILEKVASSVRGRESQATDSELSGAYKASQQHRLECE